MLASLLRSIRRDETLVVVRLDRLARSVSHLLAVIEQLEAKGAHFRSLRDPIDTTTPQGMFSLQVLGAVAQLERALIAERTKAGLQAARRRGRVGGNPGLRARDQAAIRKVRASRDKVYLASVLAQLDTWLPTVRRMRPDQPWGDVVRVLNRGQAQWTAERLRRTVRRLVTEGIVEASLLGRAPRRRNDGRPTRLVTGIKTAAPDRTLQQIAAQLEAMRRFAADRAADAPRPTLGRRRAASIRHREEPCRGSCGPVGSLLDPVFAGRDCRRCGHDDALLAARPWCAPRSTLVRVGRPRPAPAARTYLAASWCRSDRASCVSAPLLLQVVR